MCDRCWLDLMLYGEPPEPGGGADEPRFVAEAVENAASREEEQAGSEPGKARDAVEDQIKGISGGKANGDV